MRKVLLRAYLSRATTTIPIWIFLMMALLSFSGRLSLRWYTLAWQFRKTKIVKTKTARTSTMRPMMFAYGLTHPVTMPRQYCKKLPYTALLQQQRWSSHLCLINDHYNVHNSNSWNWKSTSLSPGFSTTELFSTKSATSDTQQNENMSMIKMNANATDDEISQIIAANPIIYQEFKDLSIEIQNHDNIYYGNINDDIDTTITISPISDDEFDALVRQEEYIEQTYPEYLQAWQIESGLGIRATRSGRVGTKVDNDHDIKDKVVTTNITTDDNITVPRIKRQHLSPMLSLDNVHNTDQLYAWLRRVIKAAMIVSHEVNDDDTREETTTGVTILTEPKLDGVSLSIRYEKDYTINNTTYWNLQWASTRGDGKIGQDVTPAIQQMKGIPKQIKVDNGSSMENMGDAIEVRGEVVLPRSEFLILQETAKEEKYNEENNTLEHHTLNNKTNKTAITKTVTSFSNARNAVSGILLRKESQDLEDHAQSEKLRSLLRFYAYDIGWDNTEKIGSTKELDGLLIRQILSEWGFTVAMPSTTTNIIWENDVAGDIEKTNAFETWFQNEIVQKNQSESMLEYYNALFDYRKSLEQEEVVAEVESTVRGMKGSSRDFMKFQWGDYDMDGSVHKVSQARVRTQMGYSMKSPKYSVAHKFPAQSAITHLLDIIIQVGRTGALTPVAILEPVEVGGVTIQRATLHNFGHLQDVLGDTKVRKKEPVIVRRAGDVIPQVVRRVRSYNSANRDVDGEDDLWISTKTPSECPACGSPVVWEDKKTTQSSSAIGEIVRCGGPPLLCPPRAVTSLVHTFSRDALDVTGLSEARIQQLMDAGLLRYPSDVFEFEDEEWESMAELPGWGKRSCQNLKRSIERVASNGISLGRFIYSLGIRHVGKHSSELISSSYGTVERFLQTLDATNDIANVVPAINGKTKGSQIDAGVDEGSELFNRFQPLQVQLGIGPTIIESLDVFSKNDELVAAAKDLSRYVKVLDQSVETPDAIGNDTTEANSSKPWRGFRVVFTGTLGAISRPDAHDMAKKLGAKSTPGSVSKSTDLVVYGDKGGKKLEQARALGIATMPAGDFLKLISERDLLPSEKP